MEIADILTPDERALMQRTMAHFFADPDYADGSERGISFSREPVFGEALPLEIILRDWRTDLNNGTGGRAYKQGDCHDLYVKLYESGLMAHDDAFDQRTP